MRLASLSAEFLYHPLEVHCPHDEALGTKGLHESARFCAFDYIVSRKTHKISERAAGLSRYREQSGDCALSGMRVAMRTKPRKSLSLAEMAMRNEAGSVERALRRGLGLSATTTGRS